MIAPKKTFDQSKMIKCMYTKDANMKGTKNPANIKILRQSMRFVTLTSTTNYYGSYNFYMP